MGTDEHPHWLTARQASALMAPLGLAREPARRALLAGVAGPAERVGRVLLYDAERVRALVARHAAAPMCDANWMEVLDPRCRRGMFVARVGPVVPPTGAGDPIPRGVDLLAPESSRRETVSRPWRLTPLTRACLWARAVVEGGVPFIATVSGFVAVGANLTDVERNDLPGRGARLVLEPPGTWFEPLRGGRFVTRAGGPWLVWPTNLQSAYRDDQRAVWGE